MERTTTWRNAWKSLLNDKHFIEPVSPGSSVYTSEHKLTEAGKAHASTPEYEEYLNELNFIPQSNADHQERIKKKLLNKKAVQIFNMLLKYGSLSRKELSTLLHCNDRQHEFSYGLKDLKTRKLVEVCEGKRCRLTDEAFLDASKDRPESVTLDPKLLTEGEATIQSKKKKKRNSSSEESAEREETTESPRATKKIKKKTKVEENIIQTTKEEYEVAEQKEKNNSKKATIKIDVGSVQSRNEAGEDTEKGGNGDSTEANMTKIEEEDESDGYDNEEIETEEN